MSEIRPYPKPPRRKRLAHAGRAKVKHAACRACGFLWGIERHHLVPRSLGGDDTDDNIIPLCHACHQDLHNHPNGRARTGSRIRRSLYAVEEAYILRRKGRDFLDLYYPNT